MTHLAPLRPAATEDIDRESALGEKSKRLLHGHMDLERPQPWIAFAIGVLMFWTVATVPLRMVLETGNGFGTSDVLSLLSGGLLAWLTWTGRSWARWLIVVLLGLGFMVGLAGIFRLSEYPPLAAVVLVAITVSYSAAIGALVVPRPVRAFFVSRKDARH